MNNKTHSLYHGSVWDSPLWPGFESDENIGHGPISSDKNTLKSFFVTNAFEVSEEFSRIKYCDPECQVQVILSGSLCENANQFRAEISGAGSVEYRSSLYDYSSNDDRQALYEALAEDGYDVACLVNDYQIDGSEEFAADIAVFNTQVVTMDKASLRIGDDWTEFMAMDEAIARYRNLFSNGQELQEDTDNAILEY